MADASPIVLASTSPFRRRMLEAAGLSCRAIAPDVDEARLKGEMAVATENLSPNDVAAALALAKAVSVSARYPDSLVIAADQVLAHGEIMFDKPNDLAAARQRHWQLRGTTHRLHTAAVLAQGGKSLWTCIEIATLKMRAFSQAFLESYLAHVGEEVCRTVGGYEIEGRGIQLFERIEGDYFTIIGLPLLAVLDELRARGVMVT
jgi:septum formation protein